MRADRLMAIVLILQRHGMQSAPQLAERLEVSERTILRDMDALSASGVPVYAERGANGGFRLAEGYRVDLTGMKSPEVRTLFLRGLDGVLSDLGWDLDAEAARDKLVSAVSAEHRASVEEVSQRIYVDETRWFGKSIASPFLRPLQEAIWEAVRIHLTHEKSNGQVSVRVVSPLALVAKAGVWYLIAERDTELRVYRMNRITNVEILSEHFERPKDFDLRMFWTRWAKQFVENLPRYEALLWVETGAFDRFMKQTSFPTEQVHAYAPEGYTAVRVTYETLEMARATVLECSCKVFVASPKELQVAVIERAQQVLENMKAPNLNAIRRSQNSGQNNIMGPEIGARLLHQNERLS
ncbi:helix-turn-helix transcriptional regulator [Alicyclobacillus mengziensis]|uniref:WYL domain-containing protein n=1 Tax=Alicyclobacillus mengziensis TaxID=2931921 RepID=A0A9X7W1Y5_9BACL|nr:WYL domain-containing protein [Alicyclobacillus mengziensis]QSO49206.1 WYL domain-containing protein [Alicyclobacillus mengziensis]